MYASGKLSADVRNRRVRRRPLPRLPTWRTLIVALEVLLVVAGVGAVMVMASQSTPATQTAFIPSRTSSRTPNPTQLALLIPPAIGLTADFDATFTPSGTVTPPTLTPTLTETPTLTSTPTQTETPTLTATPTITDTATSTYTPTATDTLTATSTATFTPAPLDTPIGPLNLMVHFVQANETLTSIAARYQTTTQVLITVNNLRVQGAIRPGQVLVAPVSASSDANLTYMIAHQTSEETSLANIAVQFAVDPEVLRSLNGLGPSDVIPAGRWLFVPQS